MTRHQTPYRRGFIDERDERERLGKRPLKTTIEQLAGDCLDVGVLRRFGLFGDKRCSWSALRWPDITKIRADRYSIELEMLRKVSQQIRVSWTRCHFGWGLRPWLHCPIANGVWRNYSMGLPATIVEPVSVIRPTRAKQRVQKVAGISRLASCGVRLGGNASLNAPFPERPKGMHRRTYSRLRYRAEQLEAKISPRLRAKSADYPNLVYYFDR